MEEIKVGDFVRTKSGLIRKVKTIYGEKDRKQRTFSLKKETLINGNIKIFDIVIHSKNIIDLIEVGDWGIMNCYGLIVKKVITQEDIWELKIGNYQLLKILTKERFESESYEV